MGRVVCFSGTADSLGHADPGSTTGGEGWGGGEGVTAVSTIEWGKGVVKTSLNDGEDEGGGGRERGEEGRE